MDEAGAPRPRPYACGAALVIGRELVVECDDDRLLAGEVSIEQPDTDARRAGYVAHRRRLVAALANHADRRCVKAIPGRRSLPGLSPGPAPLPRFDIFGEHVY